MIRGRFWRALGVFLALLLVGGGVAGLVSTDFLASLGAAPKGARLERMQRSPQFDDGAFKNLETTVVMKPGTNWSTAKAYLTNTAVQTPPAPLPVEDPVPGWATSPEGGLRVTWLGHSTLLIELDGLRVLTDPVWGPRASPSSIVGPKRFHPVPAALEKLPPLDAVLISHDHYDHLDYPTIVELAKASKVPFFVPLGVGAHLEAWGVPAERITELEWWQEASVRELRLVATPARHFSGRGMLDSNRTLWTSWAILGPTKRFYFSGDTGPQAAFEEIGAKFGPFDVVALEVGAYHPNWGEIHLGPENAIEAQRQLGGGNLLPVHWGTFNLGLHGWDEPGETLAQLAAQRGVPLLTPRLGRPVVPPKPVDPWWREVPAAK